MQKELPILFSTPMVQALLAGRKTQTRRLIKPQPCNPDTFGVSPIWGQGLRNGSSSYAVHAATNNNGQRQDKWIDCPYGKPGDLLWVRESLYQDGELGLEYSAGGEDIDNGLIPADFKPYLDTHDHYAFRKIPSIHMPKWAARIWLQVESVRVERLQDMDGQAAYHGESDALAEGIYENHHGDGKFFYSAFSNEPSPHDWCDPTRAFQDLWQSINGPESWEANPWVWVISFCVLSTNVGANTTNKESATNE